MNRDLKWRDRKRQIRSFIGLIDDDDEREGVLLDERLAPSNSLGLIHNPRRPAELSFKLPYF